MIKKPILSLNSDDELSMNSELHVTIYKPLKRIEFKHIRQGGSGELIQIFPNQIEPLIKFLKESKDWIDSGFKDKLTPNSYSDLFKNQTND